ncbi:aspartate/glutamate racemase family protein [Filifactor villosus]|uniref:Aspartate/glutamate racemase family protein n=1 Tax=Filifactor villosus TaxID=29374 RepID=A0ABV9QIH1_9FIRM
MKQAKLMGVIGGMGPLATMDFATKVIRLTPATKDQEHIPMIIDNRTTIPDRTNYILNGTDSPLESLIESARFLERSGAEFLVMPCNTAHYFYKEIKKETSLPFLHIVEETVKEVLQRDEIKRVALIATKGTYSCGLYERFFEQEETELLLPDEDEKQLIMDMLYAIKSGTPMEVSPFERLLRRFIDKGGDHFILGCTESPLLFEQYGLSHPVFDSSLILAQRAVEFAFSL